MSYLENGLQEDGYMGYMMALASARQTFGVIYVIFMVLVAFGGPIIATRLTRSKTSKEKAKQKKRCTVKTKGIIIDMYSTMPDEFRGNEESWSGGNRTIARYEFFVNGIRYTGSDNIFTSLGGVGKPIDVLYDPHNPSNNCTPWGRKVDNGTEHIVPIFIVLGVIVAITLLIGFAMRFFNSF